MSRTDTLKVLLDTTFLLPTLGVDVGEEVKTALKVLNERRAEIYFSRFSILESLWVSAKLLREGRFEPERFYEGLKSIIRGGRYREVKESLEIFIQALEIYTLGHRDMIDNILYSTSKILNIRLLTTDEELKEFIKSKGLKDTLL